MDDEARRTPSTAGTGTGRTAAFFCVMLALAGGLGLLPMFLTMPAMRGVSTDGGGDSGERQAKPAKDAAIRAAGGQLDGVGMKMKSPDGTVNANANANDIADADANANDIADANANDIADANADAEKQPMGGSQPSSPAVLVADKAGGEDGGEAARQADDTSTVEVEAGGGQKCSFREYVDRRYYGLSASPQPDFLQNAEYIRGVPPVLLDDAVRSTAPVAKLCIDTTEWDPPDLDDPLIKDRRPFSDGTNPSVVSLAPSPRLNATNVRALGAVLGGGGGGGSGGEGADDAADVLSLSGYHLAAITISNGQCRWRETPEERAAFGISERETPATVRTLVALLDGDLGTVAQATLRLKRDAQWGKLRGFTGEMVEEQLDDARLFFHGGDVWVLYRNGPRFGYDKQLLNVVHFAEERVGGGGGDSPPPSAFSAYIKASETVKVCCGRNMAMISTPAAAPNAGSPPSLALLTWVDPVVVFSATNTTMARMQELSNIGKRKTSHAHGTNGFLVPLPTTGELLGILHFHRPEGRGESVHARHGHHYTHAFYTVSDRPPWRLRRVSNEFVFRSRSSRRRDADVIQFASGLDLIPPSAVDDGGGGNGGRLLVSFGINDCEGAALFLDVDAVDEILGAEVEEGWEVVDLMQKRRKEADVVDGRKDATSGRRR